MVLFKNGLQRPHSQIGTIAFYNMEDEVLKAKLTKTLLFMSIP